MKQRKGHGLGPPHPHIVLAVVEALARDDEIPEEDNKFMDGVLAMWGPAGPDKKGQMDSRHIEDVIPYMVVREIGPRAKGEGKGLGNQDEDMDEKPSERLLMQVGFQPLTQKQVGDKHRINMVAHFKGILDKACLRYQGEIGRSGPPPGKWERKVQEDLKTLGVDLQD